ncbi:hypothetical protein ABZ342_40065 [Amycolatopsis sp. NPDC005961]|uniref:hypothetical protein n=1 Tax=Amycolatopsis sp. NPDC005961 TaxID=3156720 RepID=UPI0033D5C0E1
MYEALSLLAALVSAVAAVVASWIAVAQWRLSRPGPPVIAPRRSSPAAPPQLPAARPAGRGLARAAAVAVALGAVTAVFSALGDLVFYAQQQESSPGQETWLSILLGTAILAGAGALLLGLFVLLAGLVKRHGRSTRLGLLAIVLSQTFWLATWLTTFM